MHLPDWWSAVLVILVVGLPLVLLALAERVEAALVAVREQERDEDWFPEDRPVSLVHLAHLQGAQPGLCLVCLRDRGDDWWLSKTST